MSDGSTAADILRVVADPARWAIVQALAGEELCNCHFQQTLGLGQTLVSHHLKALKEAGVVEAAREGRYVYYRLSPRALMAAAALLADVDKASMRRNPRRAC